MPLRHGDRSRKEPSRINTRTAQVAATYTETLKYQDALNAPDRVRWKAVLDLEYHTFEKMGCWRVVKISILPPNVKLISCKWVIKLKYTNGVYEKHKARIVARGFEQRKGVDYLQSFSPTASQVSLRLVLALTASPGFLSVDLDATSAYVGIHQCSSAGQRASLHDGGARLPSSSRSLFACGEEHLRVRYCTARFLQPLC